MPASAAMLVELRRARAIGGARVASRVLQGPSAEIPAIPTVQATTSWANNARTKTRMICLHVLFESSKKLSWEPSLDQRNPITLAYSGNLPGDRVSQLGSADAGCKTSNLFDRLR